jgi:predicted dehydrogenase
MTNIGVVGLGFMAATHLRAYRDVPNARVAALCNPSGRHLDGDFTNVAGNVGAKDPVILDMRGVKATRHFEELLTDANIQLIDICAPTVAHKELVLAALAAGKHVICEKPLARNAAIASELGAAAERTKGFLMPAMCMRFWPEWAWIKTAIDDNRFGRVLAARFRRVAEPPAWGQKNFFDGKNSGGALVDLHIHDTDFVQFCFGRPRSVVSTGYSLFSGAVDHIVTQYEVPSGAIVHAEGGWAMSPGFGFSMACTVNFERATVDYDLARGAEALRLCQKGRDPETVRCPGPDGYVQELRHAVECVQEGRRPSVVTARDGLTALEICDAEEKSAISGQRVPLSSSN